MDLQAGKMAGRCRSSALSLGASAALALVYGLPQDDPVSQAGVSSVRLNLALLLVVAVLVWRVMRSDDWKQHR